MSVKGKRENDLGEGCNLVEKAHSVNDGKGARVDWASEGGSGLWRESRPVRKLGQLGRIPGKIQMRIWFSNFKSIWILTGFWEILLGDVEGIWTWGFFLKSSRIHKDF
jgi:hypothetical protein